jgi:hypothetical protein
MRAEMAAMAPPTPRRTSGTILLPACLRREGLGLPAAYRRALRVAHSLPLDRRALRAAFGGFRWTRSLWRLNPSVGRTAQHSTAALSSSQQCAVDTCALYRAAQKGRSVDRSVVLNIAAPKANPLNRIAASELARIKREKQEELARIKQQAVQRALS